MVIQGFSHPRREASSVRAGESPFADSALMDYDLMSRGKSISYGRMVHLSFINLFCKISKSS